MSQIGIRTAQRPQPPCVGTTNGAGAANVQTFVLSPDLVVLHVLPGFWHPEDYVAELEFSKALCRLWQDEGRTRGQKNDMFRRMQLTELRYQEPVMYARCDWQGFDTWPKPRNWRSPQ